MEAAGAGGVVVQQKNLNKKQEKALGEAEGCGELVFVFGVGGVGEQVAGRGSICMMQMTGWLGGKTFKFCFKCIA